jgi:trehalose 6-phosphate phosphatase
MLEEKGVSFALHYRNCDNPAEARARLLALVEPLASDIGARILEGKRVLELVPAGLPDKGTAVAKLLLENSIRGMVFLGDDFSDTAVFHEIVRRREIDGKPGCSIAVVDSETDLAVRQSADLTLEGVSEVEAFLELVAQALAPGGVE